MDTGEQVDTACEFAHPHPGSPCGRYVRESGPQCADVHPENGLNCQRVKEHSGDHCALQMAVQDVWTWSYLEGGGQSSDAEGGG